MSASSPSKRPADSAPEGEPEAKRAKDEGSKRFIGIEGGGTTFVVALAEGDATNVIERTIIDTTLPEETLAAVKSWIEARAPFDAIGFASFGPVDLNKSSETYGYITTTPKPNWGYTDVVGPLRSFGVPIGFDTDVNAAAIAEVFHGGHGDVSTCAYITVGTGVGVGIVADGVPIHGALHPELGHYYMAKRAGDEAFEGTCPFHGSCIEGVVSAGSIAKRRGVSPTELKNIPDDWEGWDTVAYYLAQLCVTITLSVSPTVIVIGGGVMKRAILYPAIRKHTLALLNGYVNIPQLSEEGIENYIVSSKLDGPGMVGAVQLGVSEL